MPFEILRAKTIDLFATQLTEKQISNSKLNMVEAINGETVVQSYPRRVVLELTNACNYNCIMCGRDKGYFKPTFLDDSYIECLADVFEYCEEVTLFGWGEPTIHPRFKNILRKLNRWPVRKYFVTNGSTLKDIKDALFSCKVDIMAVSIDGATAKTNNKIRKNSDFYQIVKNLNDIIRIRKENNLKFPYINFVFTMMKSNIHELPSLVKLASDIGIEEVKGVYLTSFTENMQKEVLWGASDIVRDNFDKAIQLAQDYNIKIKFPDIQGKDIADDKYHKNCYTGWRDFFLGSDYYIRPCQSTPMKLLKFDKTSTFRQMWNSAEFQDFRLKVNNSRLMSVNCQRCYQSSHANWNRKESFIFSGNDFAPRWVKGEA